MENHGQCYRQQDGSKLVYGFCLSSFKTLVLLHVLIMKLYIPAHNKGKQSEG